MRLLALLAVVATVGTLVAAPVPKGIRKQRPDAERFVGRWEAVTPEQDGNPWATPSWTFDAELVLTITHPGEGGRLIAWAVKLDPAKTPREIVLGGLKGIYEFDGDDIRVAYTSGDRPTTFDPRPEVDYHVLRRVEPKKDK